MDKLNQELVFVFDERQGYRIGKRLINTQSNGSTVTVQLVQTTDYCPTNPNAVESNDTLELPIDKAFPIDRLALSGLNDLLVFKLNIVDEYNLVHNIRKRYYQALIYTQLGRSILLSINPYQFYETMYNVAAIEYYKKKATFIQDAEPHAYKTAQMAFNDIFPASPGQQALTQASSIIINGESGSGKTEAAKHILKYFTLEKKQIEPQEHMPRGSLSVTPKSIESQIFASNPMLEAFGNAKTARNDNSSRFGKFIHLYFSHKKNIQSAKIDNYLLEKSRVVKVGPAERNYHIFYQLLASSSDVMKKDLGLTNQMAFDYLRHGDQNFRPKNESADFDETMDCLDQMNFTLPEQNMVTQIVAGILHLGNVKFQGDENSSSLDKSSALTMACKLFGFDQEQLNDALCHKYTTVGKQSIKKDNGVNGAMYLRDGLAKNIYSKLFDWLIWRVNEVLSRHHGVSQENESFGFRQSLKKNHKAMVGVLDIFGFEIFEDAVSRIHQNSFEQLCINFANESLQQHFTKHMIQSEQAQYAEEQISWAHIVFPDNKDILEVIQNPKVGIFRLLNDEGFTPKGNDSGFLTKVINLKSPCLVYKSDIDKVLKDDPKVNAKVHKLAPFGWFGVRHFAGCVIYNVDGFVEKNKDQTTPQFLQLMKTSQNQVMKEIAIDRLSEEEQQQASTVNRAQQNVITFFKGQLESLMNLLNASIPNYVRCIKPNNNKSPVEFDVNEVLRQMRCAGLMEAVKIRKAGFDIRVNHDEFFKKYRFILVPGVPSFQKNQTQFKQSVELMFKAWCNQKDWGQNLSEKFWQIGKSKVFMKEGLRNFLDQKVVEFKLKYILRIQKRVKVFVFKRKVLRNLKLLVRRARYLQKTIKNSKKYFYYHAIQIFKEAKKASDLLRQQQRAEKAFEEQSFLEFDSTQIISQVPIRAHQKSATVAVSNLDQSIDFKPMIVDSLNESRLDMSMISVANSSRIQGSSAYGQLREHIKNLEEKLRQEQSRRRDAEEKAQNLAAEVKNLQENSGPRMSLYEPRETFSNARLAEQLDSIVSYDLIQNKCTQLEIELEITKSTSEKEKKKYVKQIEDLTKQIITEKQTNEKLQAEINLITEERDQITQEFEEMTSDYMNDKEKLEKIEEDWELRLRQERTKWEQQREEDKLKQKQQQQPPPQNTQALQQLQVELQKEKNATKTAQDEAVKFKKLMEHYKEMYENAEQKEDTGEVDTLKQQIEDLQNELQQLKTQNDQSNQKIKELNMSITQKEDQMNQLTRIIQDLKSQSQNDQSSSIDQAKYVQLKQESEKIYRTLRKREAQTNVQKKLIDVMNNIVKLKMVEVHQLHRYFKITEENKAEIYTEIDPIMKKEKQLMTKFQECLQEVKKQDELYQAEVQSQQHQ